VFHRNRTDTAEAICWHRSDLLDLETISALMEEVRPAYLLNLGWSMVPGETYHAADNYRWVQAGIELLLQFARCGGSRVVMAGSCAEYDWSAGICEEDRTPLCADTPYAASKIALATVFASLCQALGLSGAWGRLFFVYGPHEHRDRLIASVVTSLLDDRPAPCSEGRQRRDYLHVADAGDAFAALLDSDVRGPVNIASGVAVSIRELVGLAGSKIGNDHLIEFGARASSSNEAPLVQADTRRLADELGWSPRFTLETGIENTIGWWRNETRSKGM
jgi:nucleoside-diphosphate-sugar epimerase